jgi:hypothetical protein
MPDTKKNWLSNQPNTGSRCIPYWSSAVTADYAIDSESLDISNTDIMFDVLNRNISDQLQVQIIFPVALRLHQNDTAPATQQ